MNVYVAGASREIARAKNVIAELRTRGFEIAMDWPAQIDSRGGRSNEGLSVEDREECARLGREAALRCDALLLLVPREPSIGAWVELGVAAAANNLILASGLDEDFGRSVFTALVSKSFRRGPHSGAHYGDGRGEAQWEMDARAIAWLEGYRDARALTEGSGT